MNHRGIDTSFYEPQVDWPLVKTQDINYVLMRASQGTYADQEFKRMWAEAKGVMPRGAYHLFDGRYGTNKPSEQVKVFIGQMEGDFGELPLFLDIEGIFATGSGYPYTGWRNWYDFLEALKTAAPGKEIGIYTAPYIWRDNTPAAGTPENEYFKQYSLWISHYGATSPLVPAPWGNWTGGNWTFWQFTDNGMIDGIKGDNGIQTSVDLNWFNGDKAAFEARFDVGLPPDVGEKMGKTVCTNGVTIEKFVEHGCELLALAVPPTAMEFPSFHYTPGQGHLVEDLVDNDLKIFWNFTPYDPPTGKVNVGLKISGQGKHEYVNFNPWIEWNDQNYPIIKHQANMWQHVYTGSQGWRYIIENFAKNKAAVDNPDRPEWNDRTARTVVANDTNGRTIVLVSKGRTSDKLGLTLHEYADILLKWVENGHGDAKIYYALDGDSGSSSQAGYVFDGQKTVYSGYPLDERNLPVAWGYFKLLEPLVSATEPPPEPEPTGWQWPAGFDMSSPDGTETKRYVPKA